MSGIQQGFMSFRSSVVPAPAGQQAYTCAGTYTWVAPAGVTKVAVVAVGGGSGGYFTAFGGNYLKGGAGGGLGYKNCITVTPGTSYTIVVGAGGSGYYAFGGSPPSTINGGTSTAFTSLSAFGGQNQCTGSALSTGGSRSGACGGGVGGGGRYYGSGGTGTGFGAGAGGAAGYSGNGGDGGGANTCNATAGTGGGGGGGAYDSSTGGGGGGVGILGSGSSGNAGCRYGGNRGGGGGSSGGGGGGGSYCGCCGPVYSGGSGGAYGGGGGGLAMNVSNQGSGGRGAVRIIWAGTTGTIRQFPSTNTGNL